MPDLPLRPGMELQLSRRQRAGERLAIPYYVVLQLFALLATRKAANPLSLEERHPRVFR